MLYDVESHDEDVDDVRCFDQHRQGQKDEDPSMIRPDLCVLFISFTPPSVESFSAVVPE
jgi:hypothetical protein